MGSSSSIEEPGDEPRYDEGPPKAFFATASRERQDFARFWEQYVPGGSRTSTVSRPLMREVLLRAVRELQLSPNHRSWAEDLVQNAVSSSPQQLQAEQAFAVYQQLMLSLQPVPPQALQQAAYPTVEVSSRPAAAQVATPSNNYARMPKGSRTVDPAPLRRMPNDFNVTALCQKTSPSPEDLFMPIRSTRSAQESTVASLRASVLRAQGNYQKLLAQAESYRGAGGWPSSDSQADVENAKLHDQGHLLDQQTLELTALRDALSLQQQRCQTATLRLSEAEEKLEEAQQENAELIRQHKTEELRATMLREAFEQEQTRVGVSLGIAEAQVKDLVTATEGTRRVEMTEQAVARECMQALNEIHAAQTREELSAEAKLNQLIRELESAKMDYDLAMKSSVVPPEPEDPSKHVELTELRRRSLETQQLFRRQLADAQVWRRKYQEIQRHAEVVTRDLAQQEGTGSTGLGPRVGAAAGGTVPVLTRLRLEEAEEAQQKAEEARLEGELVEAERGSFKQNFQSYQVLLDHGQQQLQQLHGELQDLRRQLSAPAAERTGRQGGGAVAPADNLMAAGLQRRVGLSLAAGRESQCLIQEEELKRQLAAQRLLDRQTAGSAPEPCAAGAESGAVLPPVSNGTGSHARGPDSESDVAGELRARLAALRRELNPGATPEPISDRRPSVHEQLQALRVQLERSSA